MERKNKKKYVEIECARCGVKVQKEQKEISRQERKGRCKFYCSLYCGCHSSIRVDELSVFRRYLANMKKRTPDCDVTLNDLREQWNKQQGKCAYTQVDMLLSLARYALHEPYVASVDRIDSSKGYSKNNIEFVCMFVNLGKNDFSKEQILNFLAKCKISHQTSSLAPPGT